MYNVFIVYYKLPTDSSYLKTFLKKSILIGHNFSQKFDDLSS